MMEAQVRLSQGTFSLDVGLSLADDRVLGVFGPSGSGKTTVLRAIAGLLKPEDGRIVLDGETLFDNRRHIWVPPHRRRVGYMPQQYALFPHLSVHDNVAFGLRDWSPHEADRVVAQLMDALHISEAAGRFPRSLSSGQQQRVALARALAIQPRLLLLDEPFSALDQPLRRELRRELKAVRGRAGIPMLLVSHDWADMLSLCDRMVVLEGGRVVAEGTPLDVLHKPLAESMPWNPDVDNVLAGVVETLEPESGVMTCDVGGGLCLEVPYAAAQPGASVQIGIRASDILVATEPPRGVSVGNILAGRVAAIRARGFERELVVDCGAQGEGEPSLSLTVEAASRAVESLRLVPGTPVWLLVKTTSCFLLE